MKRQLITEQDVRLAAQQGRSRLAVPRTAIVTPLAADLAYEKKIVIERTDAVQVVPSVAAGTSVSADLPSVVIGSDHGGFGMKAELIQFMSGLGAVGGNARRGRPGSIPSNLRGPISSGTRMSCTPGSAVGTTFCCHLSTRTVAMWSTTGSSLS